MTVEQFVDVLESTGMDVTYYQYGENQAPALPYIIYYFPNSDDFYADGINYAGFMAVNVEFYTRQKDFDQENLLEGVLINSGISFKKSESYLTDEHMFEVLYQMEVYING